ncbi:heme o synthase [Gammaproteobacteria bacterium]|nr:heme o synthase [Gammaproteobacteria bacterium]
MNTEAISQSQKFPISGYLKLTKPSIIYLLVLTAATAMFLADGFAGDLSKVVFGLFGIALIASSSAVINQILDVEIDSKMARTKNRPLVKGEISASSAKAFSGILLASGMILLFIFNNILTLSLTLFTWVFYSFFYTKILKFAGTQNIVIGGIAGAMPPLLGWTAITNSIDALPLLMVLIIFIWTPPHFWALSINRKEDYIAAKIPMMPVIKGTEYTKLQIVLYSVLLAVISIFPFATGYLGGFYFISATVLNAAFIGLAVALIFDKSNRLALPLFLYSIVFLTILFICMALDKLIPIQL